MNIIYRNDPMFNRIRIINQLKKKNELAWIQLWQDAGFDLNAIDQYFNLENTSNIQELQPRVDHTNQLTQNLQCESNESMVVYYYDWNDIFIV